MVLSSSRGTRDVIARSDGASSVPFGAQHQAPGTARMRRRTVLLAVSGRLLLGCFPAKRTLVLARRSALSDPQWTFVGQCFVLCRTSIQIAGLTVKEAVSFDALTSSRDAADRLDQSGSRARTIGQDFR
jgi:hypothetical protein